MKFGIGTEVEIDFPFNSNEITKKGSQWIIEPDLRSWNTNSVTSILGQTITCKVEPGRAIVMFKPSAYIPDEHGGSTK